MKKIILKSSVLVVAILMSVLFIAPAMIHAGEPAGCGLKVKINDPTGDPPTWDITIVANTWGAAPGLTYVVNLDLAEIATGKIDADNWVKDFPVNGLIAGDNYGAKFSLFDGDILISVAGETFSLWAHKQWVNVDVNGKDADIIWNANDSDGRKAQCWLLLKADWSTIDTAFNGGIIGNEWKTQKSYTALSPGEYSAVIGVDGNYSSADFTISADGGVTKADILKDNGIPGKGLENAPGLQKPFNPKSQAGEHAGKKK